ncbi:MAG: HAMP domain-containing histidine kinase [Bacteroidaceae bacterium]|nr:HAMP domain-containing histidine kinase [Bacteroidaceae bacterium]
MKGLFRIILLLVVFSSAVKSSAQNNAYGIDDECYALFQRVESLAGGESDEEFDLVNDSLLQTALAKNDNKAQVIYYVERLKHINKGTIETESRVLKAFEELKTIALTYGYKQYYYYAYELTQNFYYNNGKPNTSIELLQEMQTYAIEQNDAYGMWHSSRYMVSLYTAMSDFVTAKKYILEGIKVYNETDDPTVRRQSIANAYCDLSNTYPVLSDSMRIYINKAYEVSMNHTDTVRCNYYMAVIAALDKDVNKYRELRDRCLADGQLRLISVTARNMFHLIDEIIEGTINNKDLDSIEALSKIREMKFVVNIAELYGYENAAFRLEKRLMELMEANFANFNQINMAEFDAKMGNKVLTADLEQTSQQLARTTLTLTIIVTVVLLGLLAFSYSQVIGLRRRRIRDQKMINELTAANRKAEIANAAKTRFVQNMSHEVRTPLNAIVGFSQLLSLPDDVLSPEEKKEFSNHIMNNTKILIMLLEDILNTTDMDKGQYKITYDEGEVHYICRAAITSSEHRLHSGVEMLYEPESEDPFTFRTDPQRVQQILINLLTNACKHTSKGRIVLSSSLKAKPDYVTFTVTDTGPGIPADQAEIIFDRFTKLNGFVQGTGLGLSICREIATLMGANVYLDTKYTDGGARFVFEVPIVPPE